MWEEFPKWWRMAFLGILFPVDDEEKAVNALHLLLKIKKARGIFETSEKKLTQFSPERYKRNNGSFIFLVILSFDPESTEILNETCLHWEDLG